MSINLLFRDIVCLSGLYRLVVIKRLELKKRASRDSNHSSKKISKSCNIEDNINLDGK